MNEYICCFERRAECEHSRYIKSKDRYVCKRRSRKITFESKPDANDPHISYQMIYCNSWEEKVEEKRERMFCTNCKQVTDFVTKGALTRCTRCNRHYVASFVIR